MSVEAQYRLDNVLWSMGTIVFIVISSYVVGQVARQFGRWRGYSQSEQRRMFWGFALSTLLGAVLLLGGSLVTQWHGQREPVSPTSTEPWPTVIPTAVHSSGWATSTVAQELGGWKPDVMPDEDGLRSLVSHMPVADKIGQLMMVGFHGQSLVESPELSSLITEYYVGGIVLLERNAHDPQQVAQLIAEAQDLSAQTGSHIPLFVAINHEGGTVELGLTARDGRAEVTVSNTGPRIPPEDVERLFERFHRAGRARGRRVDGVGLGLSLARELARAHGGDVVLVESRDDRTAFRLTLPIADPDPAYAN